MTKKTISDAVTNISTEYIEKAADYTVTMKAHKPVWVKWAAMAACLCVIVATGIIISKLNNPPHDNITESTVADAAPMIYINNTLYRQSTTQNFYDNQTEEFVYLGEIKSEVTSDKSISDGIPKENFQANHPILGSNVYQYGDNIVVEIDGKYWEYTPLNEDTVDSQKELSEEDKKQLDPSYGVNVD